MADATAEEEWIEILAQNYSIVTLRKLIIEINQLIFLNNDHALSHNGFILSTQCSDVVSAL